MSSATFPAAPTPARVLLAARIGAGVVGAAVIWGAFTIAGTGLGWLFAGLIVVCVAPAVWQVAMTPQSYSVEGTIIDVHRRLLPDSRFEMRGAPERLAAAQLRAAAREGRAGERDPFARVSRRRTFGAMTDARKGIKILVRRGALVISPDDPDAFLRATAGGHFP